MKLCNQSCWNTIANSSGFLVNVVYFVLVYQGLYTVQRRFASSRAPLRWPIQGRLMHFCRSVVFIPPPWPAGAPCGVCATQPIARSSFCNQKIVLMSETIATKIFNPIFSLKTQINIPGKERVLKHCTINLFSAVF